MDYSLIHSVVGEKRTQNDERTEKRIKIDENTHEPQKYLESTIPNQLHQYQIAMMLLIGLPIQIMNKIGQLPINQQHQFFIQHQMYMQNLQISQETQLRGQSISPEILQSIQNHQKFIGVLVGQTEENLNSPNLEKLNNVNPITFSPQNPIFNHSCSTDEMVSINLLSKEFALNKLPVPTNLRLPTKSVTTQKIPLPPWLQYHGEKTHSDQQLSSENNLSNVKKKYRKSMCMYCAKIYPESAWATLKSRKFEHEIFKNHEKSTVHQRSLLELNKSSLTDNFNSNINNNNNLSAISSFENITNPSQLLN